jgi:hypothetical protein
MNRRSITRLLSVRAAEEEQAEAELGKQRQLRQMCIDALETSETRKQLALRTLHDAQVTGDRCDAISAELVLACGPLEKQILERRLDQLERAIESATLTWQRSRMCRMQMEAVIDAHSIKSEHEARLREQKKLDAWFLTSRPEYLGYKDENFPREQQCNSGHCGTASAETIKK